ncbi:hypothetical protein JHK85_004004 [Glycine max]|nr:hypothetical protein JHK85_004004 [Glycine max]
MNPKLVDPSSPIKVKHDSIVFVHSKSFNAPAKRHLVLLKKCKNVNHLKQAHAQVFTTGLDANTFALSRLSAFYSHPRQGSLTYACRVFEHTTSIMHGKNPLCHHAR